MFPKDKNLTAYRRNSLALAQASRDLAERVHASIRRSESAINRSKALLSFYPASAELDTRLTDVDKASTARLAGVGTTLERVVERRFANEFLCLDSRHFVDCTIENCILGYGGKQVVLERTHFSGCRFQLDGAAAMTASILECFRTLGADAEDDHADALPEHNLARRVN